MKKDNRGISLVEMIIVIAIMAVVSGGLAIGIGSALSKPAEECASKITDSLKNARISTMGKKTVELELYSASDGIYLKEKITGTGGTSTEKKIKIGQKGVDVTYQYSGESTYNSLGGESAPLKLSYNRATGGFNESVVGKYCQYIKVKKGSREYTLELYNLTGKVEVK
ncbi:MAG: type II secretion system protein [Candidatus Cryptobacteroides sp.]